MKRVLVIGDSCTDIFIYGKCDRLCPEAPVPIFIPENTVYNGGMTINVYENLRALGICCDILTNDIRPVKTRYVDSVSNQLLLRVDEKDVIRRINPADLSRFKLENYDIIVISDYNKGFLTIEDIEYISERNKNVFIDSKKKFAEWCHHIKFIKINEKEYLLNENYLKNEYFGNLIVTKGKDGAVLNNEQVFSIDEEHDVRDLSGAGDTFFAALVADYLNNNDICSAIKYANKCASWAVTQKGVVKIDLDKAKI
jgi:D-beta-D-heptose 7-phosphate kinase/D-beta-D-heptose 1-phosphate adenosyltransferase